MNQETKTCQNCKQEFTIEPEDFEFYEKMKVPPPTFCPECRLIRRIFWRNERALYKRKCDAPGHTEDIISLYPPHSGSPVYDQKYWWSDEWDAIQYGREYDFSRLFFDQWKELLDTVPKQTVAGNYATMINSEYSQWGGDLRNCYLVFDADYVENSAYGSGIFESRDCYDNYTISKAELSAYNFDLEKCYKVFFSADCRECHEVYFSKNLSDCSNCFGCVNLRHKSYHIFNKPYSKEQYFERLSAMNLGSYENILNSQKQSEEFWMKFPQKYFHGFSNVHTTGDYIHHSKNTSSGFLAVGAEDSKFVALLHSYSTKDCYDYTDWGENAEKVYESSAVGLGANNIKFSHMIFVHVRDVEYSYYCVNSSNLFGCVGLRKKQYCILNKQYTKEEYEELVPKIIEHMNKMPYTDKKGRVYRYGEFFPPELSPFAYNETIAQEYFPLTKDEAINKGYIWKDPEKRDYKITVKAKDLPDHIKDVPDSILTEIIQCQHAVAQTNAGSTQTDAEKSQRSSASSPQYSALCNEQCTTAFKIIPQELEFYRKMNLPLPRLCPNCRHYQRIKQRNPLKLWHRKCQCAGEQSDNGVYKNTISHNHDKEHCPNEFETTYSPERKEIVYCEECYLKEVV